MQIVIIVVFRQFYILHFFTKSYVTEFIVKFVKVYSRQLTRYAAVCRVIKDAQKLKLLEDRLFFKQTGKN